MRFSELIDRISGRVDVKDVRAGGDPEILRVCEDSRGGGVGDLFVARAGTKADGGKFVADAIAKGAVAVVAEGAVGIAIPGLEAGRVGFARVGDVNLALALLAHEVAGKPTSGMKLVGETGTKGKTTVAYLMRSVLNAAGKRVGMIGTVEIDDGVAVAPAEMTTPGVAELVELFSRMKGNGVEYVVMEVSSHSLHQRRVGGIDFAVGIFTNLTGDHLDYHGTMEEYAAAKGMLFAGLGEGAVAVINTDDKWADSMLKGCRARIIPYRLGTRISDHGWVGRIDSMRATGMHLTFFSRTTFYDLSSGVQKLTAGTPWQDAGIAIKTPLVGQHNVYNLLAMAAAASALGIDVWKIGNAALNCAGAPGRLQRVEAKEQAYSVFVDYAHTHDSLENVLKAVRGTMGNGRLICVFGCGGDRDRTKRPKMGAVAERLADRVIVTSDNPRTENAGAIIEEICAGFSSGWRDGGKIRVEADRRAAIRMAIGMAEAGDVVLIAGKGHENYQIIGTTKLHFDDVEEAAAALAERYEVRKQQ